MSRSTKDPLAEAQEVLAADIRGDKKTEPITGLVVGGRARCGARGEEGARDAGLRNAHGGAEEGVGEGMTQEQRHKLLARLRETRRRLGPYVGLQSRADQENLAEVARRLAEVVGVLDDLLASEGEAP